MTTPNAQPRRLGRPAINTGQCNNCRSSRAAVRGLCKPCDSYLRATGQNRPVELEAALSARRATRIGRCMCGDYATMTLRTNLGKMDVCQACYALEMRQAAGVFEA